MNFRFEFEYNAQERKRIDHLNAPRSVGPFRFGVLWCLCFAPTVLCLLWLQMWSVVIAGITLVLMASLVPALMKLRGAAPQEFKRSMELTPVGKREIVGDSTTFVKWNATDEIIEANDSFLFCRNDRYSLLPKRVIETDLLQSLRDQIAKWRNEPKAATEPLEMYRQLFLNSDLQTWRFVLSREDLVTATKSTSIRPVNDQAFRFSDIKPKKKMPFWLSLVLVGLLLKAGLVLILASIPPNRMDLLPMVIFLCLNPFVLLFAAAYWVRWLGVKSVPRLNADELHLRLFEGGWAIGNEDLVAFNQWNERSTFYHAQEFLGIRSDLALIHILPMRGFGSADVAWQFLDRAIQLKKSWLERKSGQAMDTQTAIAVDNGEEDRQPVNPYRAPSVNPR